MHQNTPADPRGRIKLIAAFAAVYVIWGSTYLAIRFAIETMPPFLMAGVRFLVAGLGLYLFLRMRGVPNPKVKEWKSGVIVGAFLFLGGNGGVVWAEQYVASGLAALLISTTSLWMVLLGWLWKNHPRPGMRSFVGIALGMLGIFLLIDPIDLTQGSIHIPGALVILVSCFAWAIGSIYAQNASMPKSIFMISAVEMLGGGVLLMFVSGISMEWVGFDFHAISLVSLSAFLYLIFFGSIIAITSYAYILKNAPPDKASTYAFVNPAIAVFLGWILADEVLDFRIGIATVVIICAVIIVITAKNTSAPAVNVEKPEPERITS